MPEVLSVDLGKPWPQRVIDQARMKAQRKNTYGLCLHVSALLAAMIALSMAVLLRTPNPAYGQVTLQLGTRLAAAYATVLCLLVLSSVGQHWREASEHQLHGLKVVSIEEFDMLLEAVLVLPKLRAYLQEVSSAGRKLTRLEYKALRERALQEFAPEKRQQLARRAHRYGIHLD